MVVVPGIFDGVQVLLAELKGCTLTDPDGGMYTSAIVPAQARGSADCENKGLIVLDTDFSINDPEGGAAITAYLASNELLNRDLSITSDFQGIVLYEPYFIKYPDIKSLFSNALSFVRRY